MEEIFEIFVEDLSEIINQPGGLIQIAEGGEWQIKHSLGRVSRPAR